MSIIKYNKLVRDKIPEIIEKNGGIPISRILDDKEYKKCLDEKLIEEVQEYLKDDNEEELADVYEVFINILKYKGIELKKIEEIALEKKIKRGGFDKKIYLEEVKE